MIPHPETFLLTKIINCDTNGLKILGSLDAKYVNALTEVLKEYAELTAEDIIKRIAKKELKIKCIK